MPRGDETGRASRGRATALLLAGALLLGGLGACTNDDGGSDSEGSSGTGGGEASSTRVIGSGDRYEATIRRTTGGVPHITGATLADAAFGQGFASGEDHTCDLADQIVKIRGERAKYLGAGDDDANIDSDVTWLTLGVLDRATDDWKTASKDVRSLMTAYTDGWNAHLKATGVDDLAGWCKGADWVRPLEPVEVYAYARSLGMLASGARLGAYIPTAQPPSASASSGPSALRAPDPAAVPAPAASTATASGVAPAAGSSAAAATSAGAMAAAWRSVGGGDAPIGSNGWAIGKDRTTDGGGMLVANPHFPWEGELRFWEVHLTVPGQVDIYGVQLTGVPGVGIGFTKDFGWTHTVSAGNRFTAYRLDLVPGSPTTYRYGDGTKELTPTEHTIQVKGEDGKTKEVTRTTWASHYGPVIDFPGFGWSDTATITYRDANVDNDEFIEQYLGMMRAKTLDDVIELNRTVNGVPLFNTIATSSDGRAWYADTSATPDLSAEAIAAYDASLASDAIAKIAADNGAVLLDGSDPTFEWIDEPGARDPGLVPPDEQPQVERSDYVFNANDSFWMPHATELLAGGYSPLHGRQGTVRSARTRENATVLDDTSASGPSGSDGTFTLDELADAALLNEGFMARSLREPVVERCQGVTDVEVPALPEEEPPSGSTADPVPGLPAATVDVSKACDVLAAWDGIYDLDAAGAPLWREFLDQFPTADLLDAGALWAEPFDPAKPLTTPSGLAPAPVGDGATDPVLVNLARAVQALDVAGFEPDATLGEAQFALRDGQRIPIHGGSGLDGTTNVVTYSGPPSILDPALTERKRDRLVAGSGLSRMDGETGYPITYGTSFLMALELRTGKAPRAKAFLTYGETEDRKADVYTDATERFSKKQWRDVAFTEAQITEALESTETVKG